MTPGCRSLRLELAAYADDELGVDAAIEVERHLEECGACRRAVGRQRHLSRALHELHPAAELPEGFESRVRHTLFGPTTVRRAAVGGALLVAVAGLGAAAAWRGALGVSAPTHDARPGADPMRADARSLFSPWSIFSPWSLFSPRSLAADPAPAVAAAAVLHRAADEGAFPLELASHDVGAVNAWLHAQLPFAGAVGDPGSDAIVLTGATRVMLGAHPAGLVRYRQAGRTISLFLMAEPVWSDGAPPVRVGTVDFRIFQRRGLDLVGWSHAAISYLLVSEDGLTTGSACATCHDGDARGAIAEFVAAVAGLRAGTVL